MFLCFCNLFWWYFPIWSIVPTKKMSSSTKYSFFFVFYIGWFIIIIIIITIIIIILLIESFTYQRYLMVFHWSLSDNKSPQVSRTLRSVLADLNNALVLIVSTHPLISKSFSPCTNPLVTVPRAPVIIGITVTFMFHSFFNSQARSRYYLSSRFLSVLLCGLLGQQSPQFCKFSFFIFVVVDYYKVWSSGRD